jgi:hypothetical protein
MKAIYFPFKGSNNWAFINSWVNKFGPIGLIYHGENEMMIPVLATELEIYNNKPLNYYKNCPRYNRIRR